MNSRPNILVIQADQLAAKYLGAYDNGAEFTSSIPTFAHYLRNLGYRVPQK